MGKFIQKVQVIHDARYVEANADKIFEALDVALRAAASQRNASTIASLVRALQRALPVLRRAERLYRNAEKLGLKPKEAK